MKELLSLLAAGIAIAGYIPYLRGIQRGTVQPHPYTWLISTFVSGVILAGQIVDGAGTGALPTATSLFFTLAIFVFSLKHGLRHVTKTDSVFLAAAVVSCIPWFLTKDPTLSVVLAVSIDLIAFSPTIRKAWIAPTTESPLFYGANVVRHILTLFSLDAYSIATTLHSVVMVLSNAAITLIVTTRKRVSLSKRNG